MIPGCGIAGSFEKHANARDSPCIFGTCGTEQLVRVILLCNKCTGRARRREGPSSGAPIAKSLMGGMSKASNLGVVIGVGNQKGGVGKTTNTVHIAAALGQRGCRCLIIDLDPAAGATKHLGVPENSFAGSLELLTTEETVETLAITDRLPRGVHLVPARPQLSELETQLSKFVDRTRILDLPLATARNNYDFIFLDTAPAPGAVTTVATYSSADWFLLSAFPHPLSLGGLTEAFNDIADVRQHRNPRLEMLGVVFSNVDGRATRLRRELEEVVNAALPGRRFATSISQAVILPEVSGKGKTLFQLPRYRRFPVALQYMQLAGEVQRRVLQRDRFLAGELPVLSPSLKHESTEEIDGDLDSADFINAEDTEANYGTSAA